MFHERLWRGEISGNVPAEEVTFRFFDVRHRIAFIACAELEIFPQVRSKFRTAFDAEFLQSAQVKRGLFQTVFQVFVLTGPLERIQNTLIEIGNVNAILILCDFRGLQYLFRRGARFAESVREFQSIRLSDCDTGIFRLANGSRIHRTVFNCVPFVLWEEFAFRVTCVLFIVSSTAEDHFQLLHLCSRGDFIQKGNVSPIQSIGDIPHGLLCPFEGIPFLLHRVRHVRTASGVCQAGSVHVEFVVDRGLHVVGDFPQPFGADFLFYFDLLLAGEFCGWVFFEDETTLEPGPISPRLTHRFGVIIERIGPKTL